MEQKMMVLLRMFSFLLFLCSTEKCASAFTYTSIFCIDAQNNNKRVHQRQHQQPQQSFVASSNNGGSTSLSNSPSGIDQLPELAQAGVFWGYYIALGVSTLPAIKILDSISSSKAIGLEKWRSWFIDTTLPFLLGTLYLTAGAGHFLQTDSFIQIYPPKGTWGFWYLPFTANFHVMWTGIVEALCGSGLLLASAATLFGVDETIGEKEKIIGLLLKVLKPISALTLFVLTLCVTPANIYMYTHGATMGDPSAALDVSFHYIRFGFQVMFISLLIVIAKDSLFFAWGDELD